MAGGGAELTDIVRWVSQGPVRCR